MRFSKCLILVLLSFMLNFVFCIGYKILVLIPFNGSSHFQIFEKLIKGLAKKGHQMDVVSHFPQKESIPNYNDLSLAGSLPDLRNNLTYQFVKDGSSYFWVKNLMQRGGDDICELLGHPVLQKLITEKKNNNTSYDLVIVHVFFSPCYYAFGQHLKIPIIGVVTSVLYEWMNNPFGNPVNPSFVPGGSLSYTGHMNFLQRFINTVSTTMVKAMYNYYTADQSTYVKKYFGPGFPSIYELQTDIALVLVNSHFSLNGVRPLIPAMVEVGGLHIEDDNKTLPPVIQKWLDESNHGCIYVSFGSMIKIESFPKETLKAFYATFANINPMRVLIKIDKNDELPPGLPENVKTFSWFPQIQVLKHKNVKAFVTQGGIMSTLESIYFGVPIIGVPLFVDQFSNVNHYVHYNCAIGLDFNSLNEEVFTAAIQKIIEDPVYRKSVNKLRNLYLDRLTKPLDTAIYWVEYIARNGNVLRSPALDLKWWQLELLDVYFVLFIITFTICYFIYLIIKKIFNIFYCARKTSRGFIESKKMKKRKIM